MQDVADLLSLSPPRSKVCESKAKSAELVGMSWGCPLTPMAPRAPLGLCQLRRAVGWQQGTWRSCSGREMLWLDCQGSPGCLVSTGGIPVGRKSAGPSSAPATGWFLVDCAFFVAFVE